MYDWQCLPKNTTRVEYQGYYRSGLRFIDKYVGGEPEWLLFSFCLAQANSNFLWALKYFSPSHLKLNEVKPQLWGVIWFQILAAALDLLLFCNLVGTLKDLTPNQQWSLHAP